MQITEQFILMHAPNANAAENGRKLSKKNSFSALGRTEDGNTYWADCAGSGKNPYHVSIDFSLNPEQPTCRCSCPSRQFPCKHALGLMFEILTDKEFTVSEMPADLAEKKAKQTAKAAKKEASDGESKPNKTKKTGAKNTAAQKKKLEKQLEGLDVAEKMTDELLTSGIASLAGSSTFSEKSMEKLAKDLGNYYLTGPQTSFERIALTVKKIQQDKDNAELYYADALRILVALRATIKKSREFLQNKLTVENYSAEDSVLYEALGGVWQLEDLHAIGAFRENAKLVQLSFDVSFDEAKKEYSERGFYLDFSNKDVVQTINMRPLKALKYIQADDSRFDLLEIPTLYQYPSASCPRVRWEKDAVIQSRPLTGEEQASLRTFASAGIADIVKTAKGQFKNTLLPKFMPALVPIGALGRVENTIVMEDSAGARLELRDRREDGAEHASVERLLSLPVIPEAGDALFGLVFYDETDKHICLHPYSVITANEIFRLQY